MWPKTRSATRWPSYADGAPGCASLVRTLVSVPPDLVRTRLAGHPHLPEHRAVGADGDAEHLRAADVQSEVDRRGVERGPAGLVQPGGTGVGHFTAPAVRPPTRCFSMAANRMTTGTIAMREAAKSSSQFCW